MMAENSQNLRGLHLIMVKFKRNIKIKRSRDEETKSFLILKIPLNVLIINLMINFTVDILELVGVE